MSRFRLRRSAAALAALAAVHVTRYVSDPCNCCAFAEAAVSDAAGPGPAPIAAPEPAPLGAALPSLSRLGLHWVSTQVAGISPATAGLPASDLALSVLRLRPVVALAWGEGLRFEAAVDGVALLGGGPGSAAQGLSLAPANRLRVWDFDNRLWTGDSVAAQANLDRLHLTARLGPLALQAGRQVIGHGGARLLPSADLFGPFGPGAIGTEFKRGIDALRLTWPMGQALEVEVIAVGHRQAVGAEPRDTGWRDGLYLVHLGASLPGWCDASLLAGVSYRLATAAVSVSGDAFGAGWYLEGSGRVAGDGRADLGGRSWHARATAGLDRQWGSRSRTLVEVAWQSHGATDTAGMVSAYLSLPRATGEAYLLGRWYAAALLSRQVGDLHSGQLAAIANLADGSLLLMPGLGLSLADEIGLSVGALLPVGARPLVQFAGVTLPRSEFGTSPFLGYVDLRGAW